MKMAFSWMSCIVVLLCYSTQLQMVLAVKSKFQAFIVCAYSYLISIESTKHRSSTYIRMLSEKMYKF